MKTPTKTPKTPKTKNPTPKDGKRIYTFLHLGYLKDGRRIRLDEGEGRFTSRKETYEKTRKDDSLTDLIRTKETDLGESFTKIMTFTRRKNGTTNPDLEKILETLPETPETPTTDETLTEQGDN